MSKITSKFDKVLNTSKFYGNMVHEPDSSTETYQNSPDVTTPPADYVGNYQRNRGIGAEIYKNSKIYIIGSGIAGLSAAYYFIRDGQIPASNIVFLDQLGVEGGSLDGAGNAQDGFIIRGGREMEFAYENIWNIFQDIPALELPEPFSVLDEYRLLNDNDPNFSKARLIHQQGKIQDFSRFGLSKKDQLAIVKLLMIKKEELDDITIEEYFSTEFLASNFWTLWRTMFAFENWHSLLECKLYMHRFLHQFDGFKEMTALLFPKYNQHDTFVKPLEQFLKKKGVTIQLKTLVKDVEFEQKEQDKIAKTLFIEQEGKEKKISLSENDFVVITTGSMTEDTAYGNNTAAAVSKIDNSSSGQSAGWLLWKNLAQKSPVFGKPEKFCSNIEKSSWLSVTLTCKPSVFVEKLKQYSVNDPYSGKTVTGGIITITDSNWLMSFTCNRQPHFPEQPDDVLVLWVYALFMDKQGNYVKKTMPECTGNEILTELCYHLGILDQIDHVIDNTITRIAFMPYITSMFMPRAKGDRPRVVPEGYRNLALVGQFVETNNDVVFTIESSARTGRLAVYKLLNIDKQVPDLSPLQYDIRHLIKGAKTLNDGGPFPGERLLRHVLKGTYYEHILPKDVEQPETESFLSEQFGHFKDWISSIKDKVK
ncbi:oleate hydratase [Acinetobacter sp. S40]|uniref:oleate hydratase n=1 Tax=Acinetobacter sp. S40 TaxID=2767434 RepID=UPI001909AEC1|nr:oleate hydratase [Acinetobacter sp. S40]MBJ9984559.1 oleate hydratase [Acinetobacter sp. S40]